MSTTPPAAKRRCSYRRLAACWLGAILISCVQAKDSPEPRDWTVSDSIAVRYFEPVRNGADTRLGHLTPRDFIQWSPDRRHFFYLSRRGRLETDSNIWEISVFSAQDVASAVAGAIGKPRPVASISVESSYGEYFAIVDEPTWSADGQKIFFRQWTVDAHGKDVGELRFWDLQSKNIRGVDLGGLELTGFKYASDLLFITGRQPETSGVPTAPAYPAVILTNDIQVPRGEMKSSRSTWISFRDGQLRKISDRMLALVGQVSGDAGRAVLIDYRRPREGTLQVLDSARGLLTELHVQAWGATANGLGANRTGSEATVIWCADQRYALLVNVIASKDDFEGGLRKGAVYIGQYDATLGKFRALDELRGPHQELGLEPGSWPGEVASVQEIEGGKIYRVIRVQADGSRVPQYWICSTEGWRSSTDAIETVAVEASAPVPEFQVELEQSSNSAPTVAARSPLRRVELTDVDQALENIWRGTEFPITWQEANGISESGGLILPRGAPPTNGFPLVVQAYYYLPNLFLPDGMSSTAYAAQSLVSKGIAVLSINLPSLKEAGEGPLFCARLDAAVDAACAVAPLDRTKVGLIGFSRAGFNTLYAITHPSATTLRAAISADAFTGTYASYLIANRTIAASQGAIRGNWERMPGGSFWERKSEWLAAETSFNVDRVRTPLLYTTHGGSTGSEGGTYASELMGAFRLNRKPIEIVSFPRASHDMKRPKERIYMLGLTVDWMCYWLKHETPSDPIRAARWEYLQKLQHESDIAPKKSAGRWEFIPGDHRPTDIP